MTREAGSNPDGVSFACASGKFSSFFPQRCEPPPRLTVHPAQNQGEITTDLWKKFTFGPADERGTMCAYIQRKRTNENILRATDASSLVALEELKDNMIHLTHSFQKRL